MKIELIVITAYLILLWDLTATYTNKHYQYKLEYYGLLWVSLDYWSIKKYQSSDKPMKWIQFTRSKID